MFALAPPCLEQAVYNRPKMVDRSRVKEGGDMLEAYQLAQRLQSMVGEPKRFCSRLTCALELTFSRLQRTRKRRVRDVWGYWRDAKDCEGQTYEVWTQTCTHRHCSELA